MAKTTNLEELKKLSTALLYLPIEKTDFYPAIIMHPYFSSAVFSVDGELVNICEDEKELKHIQKQIIKDINSAKKPGSLMFMVREPYYMTWLRYAKQYLSKSDFSLLLGDAWCSEENPNGDVNVPIDTSVNWFRQADKKKLMTSSEYEHWRSFPQKLTVFRGVSPGRKEKGLSWTDDLEKARWFAGRFGEGYVITMDIKKSDILAYFSRRAESEIVAYPKNYRRIGENR